MRGTIFKFLGIAALIAAAYVPLVDRTVAANATPGNITVGNETLVPFGWVDFCDRYKGECPGQNLQPVDINFTNDTMRTVRRINSWVNANITPVSDMDHWGVVDRWDYPDDGKGDCEDFALLKRRLLLDEGFPRQALLITVVKDQEGEGHAVLTLKTNKGEYILDNLDNELRGWNQTKYVFVKRQSQSNENHWVSIGEPTAAPMTVSR